MAEMKNLTNAFLGLWLLCALPSAITATDSSASIALPPVDKSVPADLREEVASQIAEGIWLYRNDTASAAASDAMVASGAIKDTSLHPTGWLTEQQDVNGDSWLVAFTEIRDGKPYAFADASVTFKDGKPLVKFQRNRPSRPITGMEAVLVHTRDLALGGKFLSCAERYNQAVWLTQRGGSELILVDLLPARTDASVYPMGGFHEFTYVVSGDAKPSHFSQTNTCLTQRIDPSTNLAAFNLSHVNSPTPTKFHIFMSLSYGKPLYVLTTKNNLIWEINGSGIRLIQSAK